MTHTLAWLVHRRRHGTGLEEGITSICVCVQSSLTRLLSLQRDDRLERGEGTRCTVSSRAFLTAQRVKWVISAQYPLMWLRTLFPRIHAPCAGSCDSPLFCFHRPLLLLMIVFFSLHKVVIFYSRLWSRSMRQSMMIKLVPGPVFLKLFSGQVLILELTKWFFCCRFSHWTSIDVIGLLKKVITILISTTTVYSIWKVLWYVDTLLSLLFKCLTHAKPVGLSSNS